MKARWIPPLILPQRITHTVRLSALSLVGMPVPGVNDPRQNGGMPSCSSWPPCSDPRRRCRLSTSIRIGFPNHGAVGVTVLSCPWCTGPAWPSAPHAGGAHPLGRNRNGGGLVWFDGRRHRVWGAGGGRNLRPHRCPKRFQTMTNQANLLQSRCRDPGG
jgi:hypothetical protein